MRKRILLIISVLCGLAGSAGAMDTVVLDAPESAYWHTDSRTWFVSNLGGGLSLAKDGYGWISRYDEGGRLLSSRWVEFLDAPTGMAAVGDLLYVADRGCVLEIDINQRRIVRKIDLPGSKFVNDVAAAPNGDLFVSDTELDQIYRLRADRTPQIWLKSDKLQNPNGLLVDGDDLIVATWGTMTDVVTFATKHPGTILRVNLSTKQIVPVGHGQPIANFDGIVKLENAYFATDWTGGRLLKISQTGTVTMVLSGFWQLADLGVDPERGILALPVMSENRLILFNTRALNKELAKPGR